ncbi:MAG: hypothetical protein ACUVQ1_08500 [Candidatus Kapaibacteriales bacterium]
MWIEIFRTGTQTDTTGRTQDFTIADLDTMVRLYNEKIISDESYQAPLVKGHPESDSPAYGWVERLARRGNILYAKLKSLSKEIIDEVRQGKFRRVSISLYPNLLLRHIGLLGSATLAIKGLRPVQFEEFDESRDFEYPTNKEVREYAELRNELLSLQDLNAQLSRQNQTLREQIRQLTLEVRSRSFRDFAEMVYKNQTTAVLPPSKADELVSILELASIADEAKDENGNRLFSDEIRLAKKIKNFIQSIQPINVFDELKIAQSKFSELFDETDSVDEFEGKQVDERRLLLHRKVKEIIEKSPNLNYEQALRIAFRNLKLGGKNGNN